MSVLPIPSNLPHSWMRTSEKSATSLYTPWIGTCGSVRQWSKSLRVRVWLHAFVICELDRGVWSASGDRRSTPGGKSPVFVALVGWPVEPFGHSEVFRVWTTIQPDGTCPSHTSYPGCLLRYFRVLLVLPKWRYSNGSLNSNMAERHVYCRKTVWASSVNCTYATE